MNEYVKHKQKICKMQMRPNVPKCVRETTNSNTISHCNRVAEEKGVHETGRDTGREKERENR